MRQNLSAVSTLLLKSFVQRSRCRNEREFTLSASTVLFSSLLGLYLCRPLTSQRKMNGSIETLKFAKLSEKAFPPVKGSEKAAGFDLKSAYDYVIPPQGKELVKTDLQIELPPNCYGRIAPRSGLAWKNHIDVGAGVVDEDYRGNIGVVIFNHSNEEFKVNAGDRIAQLICERIYYPVLQEVQNLNDTNRGEKGFGSTGKN